MQDPECLKEFLNPEKLEGYVEETYRFSCKGNHAIVVYVPPGEEMTDESFGTMIAKARKAILPKCATCKQRC